MSNQTLAAGIIGNLTERAAAQGYKLSKLCIEIGIPASTPHRWARGSTMPRMATLEAIHSHLLRMEGDSE